jgi:hypothetical protein
MNIFLETNRLLLKKPKLTDLEKLVALRFDSEVMKYTGEGGAQTKKPDTRLFEFRIVLSKKTWPGILFSI